MQATGGSILKHGASMHRIIQREANRSWLTCKQPNVVATPRFLFHLCEVKSSHKKSDSEPQFCYEIHTSVAVLLLIHFSFHIADLFSVMLDRLANFLGQYTYLIFYKYWPLS